MAATNDADKKLGRITDTTGYQNCKSDCSSAISKLLTSNKRFQSLAERKDESIFDDKIVKVVSKGKRYIQSKPANYVRTSCLDVSATYFNHFKIKNDNPPYPMKKIISQMIHLLNSKEMQRLLMHFEEKRNLCVLLNIR